MQLFFTIVITMAGGYKMLPRILCLVALSIACLTQFAPSWTTSLYIETKTFNVVSGTPTASGIYTNTINFRGVFPTPSLALSIPQIRIVSTGNMSFKCSFSALGQTSFLNTLSVGIPNTTVWFLQERYFVVSLSLLINTFQAGLYDGIPTTSTSSGSNMSYTFVSATSLAFGFNLAQNPVCIPFLGGINANSIDYYQLNLTCSITASTSFSLSATAHPNTVVSELTVYIVAYDSTDLAAKFIYYVDYTNSATYQGTQTIFASLPYGYLDSNFIGGLSSFSMQHNLQFNASLAIPTSNTVATSLSSLYDSFPQVQIRVRTCPNSAPNYNIFDNLCYTLCPSKTYLISNAFLCKACGSYCLTCTTNTVCTTCISTMVLLSGACTCPQSSYLYKDVCYGCDYTCLTCTSTGQHYNCLSCDSSNYRTLVSASPYNYTCPCKSGFVDIGIAKCAEICGDNMAYFDECDDGNSVDGDGCSSTCQIESNFTCSKDASLFSICYFIGNISISVVRTIKDPFSNTVYFYLELSPWIDLMTLLADPSTLASNGTFASVECTTYDGKDITSNTNLVYAVEYTSSMEDTFLRIDLKPALSGPFSIMPPTNVTFKCYPDNGFQMIVYQDSEYAIASVFHYICTVVSYLMLASAPLYIFGRLKWVGNMLFFSLQFQYLNLCILDSFTPMIEGLSWFKYLTGYNELLGIRDFDQFKYKSYLVLGYNLDFERNVNFMISFQVLAIVMYVIYSICWRRNELFCKKFGGDPEKTFNSTKWGKFLSFFNWQFFMFWNFFNMTNQILAMILASQRPVNVSIIPLQAFCMICIFLALLPLIVKRDDVPSYTKLLYYESRQQEQLVTLTAFSLMYLLFYLARTQNMIIYYAIMIVPIVLIIYMICRKPFQSKWVRASYFINNACILVTLIYYRIIMVVEDNALYLPFGGFIIFTFDWVFNLVVWGRQAYTLCRYGGEEGLKQIMQIKDANSSSRAEEIQDYFKPGKQNIKNASLLNKVSRAKDTRRQKYQRERFVQNMDEPQHLREQKRKKYEERKEQEIKEIQTKRRQWTKQMQQMKEIRLIKERTRSAIQKSKMNNESSKREIPSTKQKSINEALMRQINSKAFNLNNI